MNVQGDITVTANFALDMVEVMFAVDMKVQMMRGNFNPSEDTVYIGGNFNSMLYDIMSDGNNDSIYTFTFSNGYPGDTLTFKFGYYDFSQSNVSLENDPIREYIIPMGGGSYSDYFDRDSTYNPPIVVTFNANMWVKIKKGAFDPANDILVVSGDFNSWGTSDTLKDLDNDSVYSITLQPGLSGDTIKFKFRYWDKNDNPNTASNWEDNPDRLFVIPDGGGTFEDYFNRDSVYVEQHDIQVTFSVNMELERLSGRFDPVDDVVEVRGSFNGWGGGTLTSNALNPDLFEGTFTIRAGVGESFRFKFWYEDNNWESFSNDRVYTFTQSDIDNLAASINESFNNGSLETVINQTCTIKFTCYTTGAKSILSNNTFPVVNSVWIAGSSQPLQWPGDGWPNSDTSIAIRMYDDGTNGDITAGDQIFSRDVLFPAYTVLDVQYKYSINFGDDANNEGGNDNEAGFAANHELHMDRYLSSATAVDTFGTVGPTVLEDPLGIGDDQSGIPFVFSLNQNYPNPFNPSTTINYSLAVSSPVVLKVYDMLGREVETLVNGVQQSGTYTLSFSPKNLPSGIYYYRLTTNNFVETKTMMYVK
ncbi:MAG: T9SS type A sorting domain-containing protein [Ignavibacteriae bacterium]|nr:T9SS type A sorting domain-containing protein [Ignavibacteriota bacterium]